MPKFEQNFKRRSPHPKPETLKPIQIDETIQFTSSVQVRDAADPDLTESLVTVLEKMEALGLISPEQLLEDEGDDLDLEAFEAQIREVLGSQVSASPKKQLNCYLNYLKRHVENPCHLTGVDEFEWEEKYLFGSGSRSQYEKLKKHNPSHSDIFLLVRFSNKFDLEDGIKVEVQRLSDGKNFTLPLVELEGTEPDSSNYQLLEDYSLWFLNYFSE